MRSHYLVSLALADAEVRRAAAHTLLPSACADWSIGDVVRHVVLTQRTEVAGEEVATDPSDSLLPAADVPDVMEQWPALVGELSAIAPDRHPDTLFFPALDLTMHAWDIRYGLWRAGLAEQLEFSDATMTWLDEFQRTAPEDSVRAPGIFAAAVPPPPGASSTARFMAWAGRRVD